ncbi:MAG: MotA/TolQ/ExbB proton channel family protein, partial [Pseudomonadota bacterium]
MTIAGGLDVLRELIALGGPVVAVLLAMSVAALAVVIWKLVAFVRMRVGRHDHLQAALAAWDRGDQAAARAEVAQSRSHLAPVLALGLAGAGTAEDRTAFEARLATAAT